MNQFKQQQQQKGKQPNKRGGATDVNKKGQKSEEQIPTTNTDSNFRPNKFGLNSTKNSEGFTAQKSSQV